MAISGLALHLEKFGANQLKTVVVIDEHTFREFYLYVDSISANNKKYENTYL